MRKTAKSSPVNVDKFVLLRFGTFEHALLVREIVLSDDVVEPKLLESSVDEYFLEGLRCFLLFVLLRDERPTGGLKSGGSGLLGPPRTVPLVERVVSLVFFFVVFSSSFRHRRSCFVTASTGRFFYLSVTCFINVRPNSASKANRSTKSSKFLNLSHLGYVYTYHRCCYRR